MTQSKHCLALMIAPVLLAVILSGCIIPEDLGTAVLVDPERLDFGEAGDTIVLTMAKNTTATGQAPIVLIPTASWITVDHCADTLDDCLSGNPRDSIEVVVSIDRSVTDLGPNEAALVVQAGNSPIVQIPVALVDNVRPYFEVNLRRVQIGQPMTFTNLSSTSAGTPDIVAYEWNFGDGTTSNLANPGNVIYSEPGHYDVSLTVRTAAGYVETFIRRAFVAVGDVKPTVNFSGSPITIATRQAVDFTDLTALPDRPELDPEDFIESWLWDFGDGATSTERNPRHQFINVGNYDITLTVSTAFGDYSRTKRDYIHVQHRQGPVANFYLPEEPVAIRQPVSFQDLSDPGAAAINSWYWDFGDGSFSTVQNPSHAYVTAGTFDVSLTVHTDYGSDTMTKQITTRFEPPTADFEADDLTPGVGQAVRFTDLSTPGSDPIVSWLWDFGDGTTSTERQPSHVYTQYTADPITVTLTVTSSAAPPLNSALEVKEEYLTLYLRPTLGFHLDLTEAYGRFADDQASVLTNDPVTFVNDSTPGTEDTIQYTWDFGDGSFPSVSEDAEHTYAAPGYYTVTLTAVTATQTVSMTRLLTVDSPPTPNFSASPRNILSGTEVAFTDASTPGQKPTGVSPIEQWIWDFGDGQGSYDRNPAHVYAIPDSYDVMLTVVFRHSGAGINMFASITKDDLISVVAPSELAVTTLEDILDGDTTSLAHLILDPGNDGLYSLREIMTAANAQAGGEVIRFAVEGTINLQGEALPALVSPGTSILGEGKIRLDGAGVTVSGVGLDIQASGCFIDGLTFSGFAMAAVRLMGEGATDNTIQGCLIGTDGTQLLPNGNGILLQQGASGNLIGGASADARNVISGNVIYGVAMVSADGNILSNNYIGTDATGLVAMPNQIGVYIDESAANTIGSGFGAGNLISGNTDFGVEIDGASATDNRLMGDFIGMGADGVTVLANGVGVVMSGGANNNRVGDDDDSGLYRNLISGNIGEGIRITGEDTTRNRVSGNIIGLDGTLAAAAANGEAGITILEMSSDNFIGASSDSQYASNLIAGNDGPGIKLSGEAIDLNTILNNTIGAANGLGNVEEGILIEGGAAGNTIGGDEEGDGNLIFGNGTDGVRITGAGSDENLLMGNLVVNNGIHGINVGGGAIRARIGRILPSFGLAAANIIRANANYGVSVTGVDSLAVSVRENEITLNGVGAIALEGGANMGTQVPVITAVNPLRGTSAPFATIDVFVDRVTGDPVTIEPHALFVGSTTARLSGVWNADDGDVDLSNYDDRDIWVTATDAFGNTSVYSAPYTP